MEGVQVEGAGGSIQSVVPGSGSGPAEPRLLPVSSMRLRPPIARPGVVERTAILDRIDEAPEDAVVAVVAPGGYGKTTLLRQWVDRRASPTAWISLDLDDNDPTVLLTSLATALTAVVHVDDVVFEELGTQYPSAWSVGHRLANALAVTERRFSLVLDDVHLVANPACHDVLSLLAAQTSARAGVAVASREVLPLPTARLRAEDRLVEVDARDLAMDAGEATSFAAGIGRELSGDRAQELVVETEGWPVAVYLGLRSTRLRRGDETTGSRLGHLRPVVEYLQEEFLSGLDAETMQFLTRSSVLERMSGPSCDAVLRTYGSAARLEQYARSNLLVVPLDDRRTWYRYHAILRDLLRSELDKREPEVLAELQVRAAAWCEAHGRREDAVDYAIAGGDVDRAARLVSVNVLEQYRSGRVATLERWFTWFDQDQRLDSNPMIAIAGAWVAALGGRAAVAERRATAAEATRPRTSGDVGDVLDGLVDLVRATLCRQGIGQARVDVERARRLLPREHPWTPTMLLVAGIVTACSGDADEADRRLTEATELLEDAGAHPGLCVGLAQRAELAMARDDRRTASSLVAAAVDVVEAHHLQDQIQAVYVLAVAAEMAGAAGDADRARGLVARANRGRPQLNHALPHIAVQARLALARAMLSFGDGAGARTVMREVDGIVRQRPGLGVLDERIEDMRSMLRSVPTGVVGSSSLTSAELRVLPLLQTHLTFREVGERLHVSPNTVKTHAISVYRKLGVSSRSEAVERAVEIGLLRGWT